MVRLLVSGVLLLLLVHQIQRKGESNDWRLMTIAMIDDMGACLMVIFEFIFYLSILYVCTDMASLTNTNTALTN
jgi:hypothetical protein